MYIYIYIHTYKNTHVIVCQCVYVCIYIYIYIYTHIILLERERERDRDIEDGSPRFIDNLVHTKTGCGRACGILAGSVLEPKCSSCLIVMFSVL